MPDTLSRFGMVGDLNDRHMAPVADGNYVLYLDYRAHIDALTARLRKIEVAAYRVAFDKHYEDELAFDMDDLRLAILRGEQ